MVISDYDIGKEVGRGAGGVVYQGTFKDGTPIAVKKIDVTALDKEDEQLVWQEIQFLSNMEHENIIGYYEHWQEPPNVCVVMEFANGGDLDDKYKNAVKTGTLIKEDQIGGWTSGIVNALGYLHENGVMHRDIKLANLMLTGDGNIKLCDFGMASEFSHGAWLEEFGKGTPLYQSPELCQRKPYNEKVDVWAMGCVLYELAARKRPFDGKNMVTISNKIVSEKPKPLSSAYSASMRQFITHLLEKDVMKRPSMLELVTTDFVVKHRGTGCAQTVSRPKETIEMCSHQNTPETSVQHTSQPKRRFLQDDDRNTESPKAKTQSKRDPQSRKSVDILKRLGEMKKKVTREENSQFSESMKGKLTTHKTPGQADVLAKYCKGEKLIYDRTGEEVTVTGVHLDDPAEPYYTITMQDGRDKQTIENALHKAVPMANALAVNDNDDWESQFSPQGQPVSAIPATPTSKIDGCESLGGFDVTSPAWDSADYPEGWGQAADWTDDIDQVHHHSMSAAQVAQREQEGDGLTLAQLREHGRQQVAAVRLQNKSEDWIKVGEVFGTGKIVRTIIRKIRPDQRSKAACVCKCWQQLIAKGGAKKAKRLESQSLNEGGNLQLDNSICRCQIC